MQKTVFTGLALMLLSIGLGIASHNVRMIMRVKACEGAQAQAKIVLAEMNRYRNFYTADIEYAFYTDGKMITGECGISSGTPNDIKAYLRKYKKGQEVVAYYDPNDPYETALEPEISSYRFVMFGVSLVVFILPAIASYAYAVGDDDDSNVICRTVSSRSTLSDNIPKLLLWIGVWSTPAIVGLIIVFNTVGSIMSANDSKTWTPVQATIVSSTIKESWHKGNCTEGANIEYKYSVSDELIVGNLIRFGGVTSAFGDNVSKYLRKYKKGNKAVVYYNPDNPEESVLEPGIHTSMWYPCIFGICLIGLGFWLVLVGVKMFREPSEQYEVVFPE